MRELRKETVRRTFTGANGEVYEYTYTVLVEDRVYFEGFRSLRFDPPRVTVGPITIGAMLDGRFIGPTRW